MTLTELRQEVYTLTNRPDLVNETLTAIRSATLKLHTLDYFYKDIFETGITFPDPGYLQQLEYRTVVPRWRALKYLRKTDVSAHQDGEFLTVLSIPEMVEDDYKLNRNNVCYVAGQVVQIRSSDLLQYALLGCYIYPDITEADYDSWIALDHPYAIVFEAASKVFKIIGDTDQFNAFTQLAREEAAMISMSNIQAVGY
jgi:hypothetical protein